MSITFYNLESYEHFHMGICKSLCHSFNFVNVRFVVKVIFFPLNSTRRFTFMESLMQCTWFCYFSFYSHIYSFEWINSFLQKTIFSIVENSRKVTVLHILFMPWIRLIWKVLWRSVMNVEFWSNKLNGLFMVATLVFNELITQLLKQ